ncbi:MAG: TIGR04086 family membrane protein [Clostridia bacterium]|nr:TIGR04086 family membrane protein [Clostridia bacterium]
MERKRSARKNSSAELSAPAAIIKNSFIGAGIATVMSVVLLFAATVIAYANADPDSVTGMLGLSAVYLASMAAGFCAVKINKQSALICGALSGAIFALLFFAVSLFFDASFSSGYPFIARLGMRAAMIFMSVLGAFAGLHRSSGKRRKKR